MSIIIVKIIERKKELKREYRYKNYGNSRLKEIISKFGTI